MIRRIALVVSLACGFSACGIPTSKDAAVVPDRRVPFRLLSPTIPSSTTTTQPAAAYVSEPIYLVQGDLVREVRRDVVVPAGLTDVLAALVAGPTSTEATAGLTTTLPRSLKLLDTTVEGSHVTLDLSVGFGAITGSAETLAVAQLVLTATSQPGVSTVSFAIAGRPISVPTPSGVTTPLPVSAADYSQMVAR